MNKEALVKIIDFWKKAVKEGPLFPRSLTSKIDLKSEEIIDIVGPRRSGKSSILQLLAGNLPEADTWLYLNFEDPFFIENNQTAIIEDLIDVYKEYFSANLKYLFFDEIQNIEKWEKAVRKFYDGLHYKIFVTGSSSKLLSGELSSLITGRHLSHKLLPLTFKEYLSFKKVALQTKKELALRKAKIFKYFEAYLGLGGFPKIALEENEGLLKQYYSDILEKDIIKRHKIRQTNVLGKMGVYLLSNAAKTLSLSELEKTFSLSFEATTTYLGYFKEAFLIFDLPQFSYSLKTQQKAFKKIYAVDTGLANAVSFRFSEDRGRILENCVFLHLNQLPAELFYYKTKNDLEVDFLVKYGDKKIELVQVCTQFNAEKTRQREVRALVEAMDELHLSSGLILTETTKAVVKTKGKNINVLPVYEWALTQF